LATGVILCIPPNERIARDDEIRAVQLLEQLMALPPLQCHHLQGGQRSGGSRQQIETKAGRTDEQRRSKAFSRLGFRATRAQTSKSLKGFAQAHLIRPNSPQTAVLEKKHP